MLSAKRALLGALLLLVFLPSAASAQATRTWISGVGDDVNPCSRTAPCKTWAGAISKTAADGTIDVLDPGGYGSFSITKGITLNGRGWASTTFNGGLTAINVNAPGKDVIIRDLAISGGAAGPCAGGIGINLVDARSLFVSGVTIDNAGTAALNVVPATGNTNLLVRDSEFGHGCGTGDGISIAPQGAFTVSATLDGVTLSNLDTALLVNSGGTAWLTGTTIFGNTLGLSPVGTGAIHSLGDNSLNGNTTNGTPTSQQSSAGRSAPHWIE